MVQARGSVEGKGLISGMAGLSAALKNTIVNKVSADSCPQRGYHA